MIINHNEIVYNSSSDYSSDPLMIEQQGPIILEADYAASLVSMVRSIITIGEFLTEKRLFEHKVWGDEYKV